jgi:hypothetical protein
MLLANKWRVDMETTYSETGGVRYGHTFTLASNYTWPFAKLTATSNAISITVSLGRLWSKTFSFERASIRSIVRKRGLWSVAIQIIHTASDYPPFMLFWTFRFARLRAELQRLGYEVSDAKG